MAVDQQAVWAGALVGGAVAGTLCGMLPLGVATKRGYTGAGILCLFVCIGAGLLGGLCLGIPAALVLTWIVSALGPDRSRHSDAPGEWDDPGRVPGRAGQPYTRIGPSVVCNHCRTATRADNVPPECPGCGLPFRRGSVPTVYPSRGGDDVIDLEPARPDPVRRTGRR